MFKKEKNSSADQVKVERGGVKKNKPITSPVKKYLSFMVFAIAALILIGSGIWYVGIRNVSEEDEFTGPCSVEEGPILLKASSYINPVVSDKLSDLGELVKNVEQIEGYDKDQNCMLVALTYYINISDSQNARVALDKLKIIYDQATLSPLIDSHDPGQLEMLEGNVKHLERINKKDLGSPSFGKDPNEVE